MQDNIRLGLVNGVAMVMSFTAIENTMKIILLGLSIIYTTYKVIEVIERRRKNKKK